MAKKKVNANTNYLQLDPTYKQQSDALGKARRDYIAQQGTAQTNYLTNYGYDLKTMQDNRKAAFGDQENDYAARGMMQSGLYGDALAKHNNQWDQRRTQLENAKKQYTTGLANDLVNFKEQQSLTDIQARQEAAARRALRLGI
jgi:hypothetical protein